MVDVVALWIGYAILLLVAALAIVFLTWGLGNMIRRHPLTCWAADELRLRRVLRWRDFYAAFHADGIQGGVVYPRDRAIDHARKVLAQMDADKNDRGPEVQPC